MQNIITLTITCALLVKVIQTFKKQLVLLPGDEQHYIFSRENIYLGEKKTFILTGIKVL